MYRQRGEPERLQKVLARAGLASRREAEDWIRAGRLTVNGQPAALGIRVSPEDEVRLDGRVIHQRAPQSGGCAYIYHRSPGESLDAPPADAPDTLPLLARLPKSGGRRFVVVSPMPRIDGGLELVCGDGELAARLQRSVRGLSSELSVRVRGELTEQQIAGVLGGVLDSGEKVTVLSCEPAGGEGANRWYAINVRGASGKDVRQLFERQGAIVSRVLRTRLGSIALDRALARGHFRELTREQIEALLLASSEAQPEGAAPPLPAELRQREVDQREPRQREPRQREPRQRETGQRDTRRGEDRRSGKRPRHETGDRADRPRDRRAASGHAMSKAANQTAGQAPGKNRRSNQSQSAGGRRSRRPPGAPVRRGRTRD